MEVVDIPEEDREQCPICLEQKEDLRTLPCWHIGCLTCILGMTQSGVGKAVTCHLCRQPCLFENIRSLPIPLRCAACDCFVRSPKKFPCCSNLHCSECIDKASNDGKVACQNFCSYNHYNVAELPTARLCVACFALHTMKPAQCGHLFCSNCLEHRFSGGKRCPVCVAVSTPRPAPTDPFGRSTPVQGEAFFALQMIRMLQEQQARRVTQFRDPEEQLLQAMQMHIQKDVIKGFIFLVIISIAAYFWGLSLQLWVVGFLTLLLLRLSLISKVIVCGIVNIGLLFASFYYYFWDSMILVFVDTVVGLALREMEKVDSNKFVFPFLASAVAVVLFIVLILFFPPLFVHRMAFSVIIQNLGRFVSLL